MAAGSRGFCTGSRGFCSGGGEGVGEKGGGLGLNSGSCRTLRQPGDGCSKQGLPSPAAAPVYLQHYHVISKLTKNGTYLL